MGKLRIGYQFDFRNPPGSGLSFPQLYREMFKQIDAAEDLGFDSIWLTEHHFTDDGYLPATLPVAAAIASRTKRAAIGTYVLLAPFYHPLKLAEDTAVIDVISNGRLRLGIGMGYRAEEFAGFGIPRAERLGRTLETIEILKRAWTGQTFSFEGKYFRFRDVRVLPRPASEPHPEILWGAASPAGIRRAANLDFSFACIGGRREIGIYLEALRKSGKDPSRYSIVNSRSVYIADSEEQAWRDAGPALVYQAELYSRWLSAATGVDPSKVLLNAEPERLKRASILGPVDYVRRQLDELIGHTPMTDLMIVTQLPGMDPAKCHRSLMQFGKEILPALKSAA
jgi:alkanesulfonate monooxygenase SsuD/methylene tetrahydromethanopterin reductase-like flavin-dependent oxidoreductase (luciferase family)